LGTTDPKDTGLGERKMEPVYEMILVDRGRYNKQKKIR